MLHSYSPAYNPASDIRERHTCAKKAGTSQSQTNALQIERKGLGPSVSNKLGCRVTQIEASFDILHDIMSFQFQLAMMPCCHGYKFRKGSEPLLFSKHESLFAFRASLFSPRNDACSSYRECCSYSTVCTLSFGSGSAG